ncbi:MAG: capsule assembly Wzi family protein [Tannerella sp.]|jgi:hypothetical protein|nr:capsule assembly Wzi family protein [Tannerella sp.]
MRQRFLSCILLSICFHLCNAQDEINHIRYGVTGAGTMSTKNLTPFWMVSNQNGIIPLDANNGYLRMDIEYHHVFNGEWSWNTKADIIAVTPRYKNIYIQQFFTELAYKGIRLSIGSREYGQELQTVTDPFLSSGDMGLANNARPIPEINLYSPGFIVLPWIGRWVQGKGNFAAGRSFDTDYLESFKNEKQFYIQNPLWHHKSLYLRVKDAKNHYPFSFIAGIRHVAQWGGQSTNPRLSGMQPHTLKDFFSVVFGQSGGSTASLADQINVLGAHYGTYDFSLSYEKKDWGVRVYYQHLISDASGMEFVNALDGLKGIQLESSKYPWLKKLVIEHLYSMNQSGPFHFIQFDHTKYPGYGGGGDNYYNNGEYTTGFSYFNRSLGSPFFLSPEYNQGGKLGFRHNRLQAWYLGAEGAINHKWFWRLRLSTMDSYGTPQAPSIRILTANSLQTDFFYSHKGWTFTTSIAADQGSLPGNHWGFGLSVTKKNRIPVKR